MASAADPLISLRHIRKSYGHVEALRDVNLDVWAGEVLTLVGDNGAGKSTLMRVIAGSTSVEGGDFIFRGQIFGHHSIAQAMNQGIELVYQDLAQTPDLSVADNMFLGREPLRTGWRRYLRMSDRVAMERQAREALRQLSIELPSLRTPVRNLSGGQRQAVAIARAVMWADTAILMDEPTAALAHRQRAITNDIIRSVATSGLAVLVVSHDIPNMLNVAHRIAIMRQGRIVAVLPTADLSLERVLSIMLGGAVTDIEEASNYQ